MSGLFQAENEFGHKITDAELIPTIEKLRNGNRREKNQAYFDLVKSYSPLLVNLFNTVNNLADNPQELEQVEDYIKTKFVEILISKYNCNKKQQNQCENCQSCKKDKFRINLECPIPMIKGYFTDVMKGTVSVENIRKWLGKDIQIKMLEKKETCFKETLKYFHLKNHREPNLISSDKDRYEFAELMNVDVADLDDVLQNSSKIKSIYSPVSENTILLEVLEGEVSNPTDLHFFKVVLQYIEKHLTPEEQSVIKEYYCSEVKQTKEQVAEKLGISLKQVIYRLIKGRRKLERLIKYKTHLV